MKYIIRTYGTQAVTDAYDNFEEAETDDRVVMDVEHEIAENANSEDFIVDSPAVEVTEEANADKAPFEE